MKREHKKDNVARREYIFLYFSVKCFTWNWVKCLHTFSEVFHPYGGCTSFELLLEITFKCLFLVRHLSMAPIVIINSSSHFMTLYSFFPPWRPVDFPVEFLTKELSWGENQIVLKSANYVFSFSRFYGQVYITSKVESYYQNLHTKWTRETILNKSLCIKSKRGKEAIFFERKQSYSKVKKSGKVPKQCHFTIRLPIVDVIYRHKLMPVINCFMPKSKANCFYSIYKNTVNPSFYQFTFLLICGNTQKLKSSIKSKNQKMRKMRKMRKRQMSESSALFYKIKIKN